MHRAFATLSTFSFALAAAALAVAPTSCFTSSSNNPASGEEAGLDANLPGDDGGPGVDASMLDSTPGADSTSGVDAMPGKDATAGHDAAPDATPVDAAGDASPEAGVTTGPVKVGTSLFGTIVGAAAADGTALLLVNAGIPAVLQASHYDPGSGWSAPTPIPGSASNAGYARLGMDASGNAFAVWATNQTDAGSRFVCAVSRYDHVSNTWGQAQYPDTTGQQLVQEPALSVNASGEALVIDPVESGGTKAPLVALHYASGAWTSETVLSAADFYTFPTVYLTDTGVAVAAALNGMGGIGLATRAGTTWTSAPAFMVANTPYAPAVTANAAGDVLVAWEEVTASALRYQYDATAHAWNGPATLSAETATSGRSCGVTVGLTTTGDGVVTRCYDGPSGNSAPAIEAYAFTKSAGTWSSPLVAGVTGWAYNPAFAFTTSGTGFTAYVNVGSSGNTQGPVETNDYTFAGGWGAASAPQNADGGAAQYYPIPFVSPSGAGWVAWTDGNDTFVRKIH